MVKPSRQIWKGLALTLGYVLTARLGLQLASVSGFATLIWVPTGISFAALYLWGRQFWPGVFVGAAVANFLTGAPVETALLMALGNTLEAFIGVSVFQKLVGPDSRLERVRDVAIFVAFGAVFSPMVSATVGVGALLLNHTVSAATFWETWRAWWVGDALSDLVIAPVFLVWRLRPVGTLPVKKKIEGLILSVLLITLVVALFVDIPSPEVYDYLKPQWVLLFLLWGILRFGQHANVLMIFILSVIATTGTVMGYGPYMDGSLNDKLLFLQLFTGSIALAGLFFGALASEKENALRMRTDFISIASHELRTPITSLSITLQILRELLSHDPSGEVDRALTTLDRQAGKLTALVDALLNVAQIESGNLVLEKEDTDISLLVNDVFGSMRELLARTSCEAELDVEPRVCGKCSAYGIEQVLTNLLMNSIKYGAGKPVKVTLRKEGNRARLTVRDQGPGIAPEHHKKIFERYERLNRNTHTQGLGLGLYVSRLIVDAHAGSISVDSDTDKGAAFIVDIPLS